MELIDILDEEGNKAGETATIEHLHQSGDWHKVVGIVIYDFDNNVFINRNRR